MKTILNVTFLISWVNSMPILIKLANQIFFGSSAVAGNVL